MGCGNPVRIIRNTGFPVKPKVLSSTGNDIRGIILYENYNNMELYLGGGHKNSYNLRIIKHYKEMSLIFLTLPHYIRGGPK